MTAKVILTDAYGRQHPVKSWEDDGIIYLDTRGVELGGSTISGIDAGGIFQFVRWSDAAPTTPPAIPAAPATPPLSDA